MRTWEASSQLVAETSAPWSPSRSTTEIIEMSGASGPKSPFHTDGKQRLGRELGRIRQSVPRELRLRTLTCCTSWVRAPSQASIAEKDRLGRRIIYVGGGNTLKMMRRWRRLGVDDLLRSAHSRGAVLCGVSAGAICWFDSGSQRLDVLLQSRRLELHRCNRHGPS